MAANRRRGAAFALALGVLAFGGLAARGEGGASLESNSPVPTARALFEAHCSGCHGTDLAGGQGPSLVDATWIHGSDDDSLMRVIAGGVADKGMPAFAGTLDEAQRRSLVAYIRERGAAAPAATTPFPATPQVSQKATYRIETVTTALATPWSVVFLAPDRMLVSERPGHLRVVHADGRVDPPVTGTPPVVHEFIHGGMLGLALAPDYARSGWIYLAYTEERPDRFGEVARCAGRATCFATASQIRIVRGRLKGNAWTDQQTVWEAPAASYRVTPNFGGRMAFGADGMLYFSVGDRVYSAMEAQDLSSPNGKLHRVAPDGKIPADNPFVHTPGAVASIWSLGHRNPEGLALDPATGVLWESEHGPRGGDELNHIVRGANYGWPWVTYGMGYDGRPFDPAYPIGHSQAPVPVPPAPKDLSGMTLPVTAWVPSIAVGAIGFYEGAAFPGWRGSLFVTSLKAQELRRLTLADGKVTAQEVLQRGHGRLRDVAFAPDGTIVLAVNEPDMLVRLVPARTAP